MHLLQITISRPTILESSQPISLARASFSEEVPGPQLLKAGLKILKNSHLTSKVNILYLLSLRYTTYFQQELCDTTSR